MTQPDLESMPIGDVLELQQRRSHVVPAEREQTAGMGGGDWGVFWLAGMGNVPEFPAWGTAVNARDGLLRHFAAENDLLSGAVATIAFRNAGFRWKLDGAEEPRLYGHKVLTTANLGAGWEDFVTKLTWDVATQDKGAFVEIIKTADAAEAPTVGIRNLDAARCWHTGDELVPVRYMDRRGRIHPLKYYQVWTFAEMPTQHELLYGLQLCAVSRFLQTAQRWRNVVQYLEEKTGGRNQRAVHLVQGFLRNEIQQALDAAQRMADQRTQQFYIQPAVAASMQKDVPIKHELLELATLPDGFNEEVAMKVTITMLALAFGTDYQEFAPLASGSLGSATQSETLDKKAASKSAELFRRKLAQMVNHAGILPDDCEFAWDDQDPQAEQQQEGIKKTRADTRATMLANGEIDAIAARQLAVDAGDLPEEYLAQIGERDATRDAAIGDALAKGDVIAAPLGRYDKRPAPRPAPTGTTEGEGRGEQAREAPTLDDRLPVEEDAAEEVGKALSAMHSSIRTYLKKHA